MSVLELPRPEADLRTGPPPAVVAPSAAEPLGCAEFSEAEFARLFKVGFLLGTPAMWAILSVVVWLAAPGNPGLFLAALWAALVTGWYFGGIVAAAVVEFRYERAHHVRSQPEAPGPLFGEPVLRPGPSVLVR
jgi:hypothetical protein